MTHSLPDFLRDVADDMEKQIAIRKGANESR